MSDVRNESLGNALRDACSAPDGASAAAMAKTALDRARRRRFRTRSALGAAVAVLAASLALGIGVSRHATRSLVAEAYDDFAGSIVGADDDLFGAADLSVAAGADGDGFVRPEPGTPE